MHTIYSLFIVLLSLFSVLIIVSTQQIHKRFEYKYSFKGPYLAQKDNSVPFWSYSGSAIASEESFRITPSLRSQKGQAWAKNPTNFEWWEVEIVFRVNGRGRIGADGLAFWFMVTPGVEGPVFGSSDMWNGFGLFFDSFDNDNKRNNPYIMGMVNNGSLAYDHEHDGASQQMGGCLRDFRNKPFPIRAKIEYYKNILTVFIHNGMTENEKDYEICFRAEGVVLPTSGYYGVTAATGGLADDHDVLKFLVNSLRSSEEMAQMRMNEEEEARFQKEFEVYQQKTQKARDDYLALNPDAVRKDQQEYETSEARELRQIFQGQGQIFDVIKHLSVKLDEVVGKQDRTLSLVSGGQINIQPGQGQLPAPEMGGSDLNRLLVSQNEVVNAIRDIKQMVSDVQVKSQQILNKPHMGQGSVQPVGGGGYDFHITLKELNEGLNIIKRDLSLANQKLGVASPSGAGAGAQVGGCPQVTCVSTAVFVVFMVCQVALLLGYFVYRDSKEAKAKKFY